ncbi:phage tail protein [Hymenobacter sp. HSC-4F20]|uniref:phage tail tube protein n=1 Tax=Hymenobacter sp. HSC-4F20 TaxID=2864135 RepID=UPI001C72AC04|nr:phage tail tube protein [Hymenobacter sp. HSC-4F20]MBX0290111.1 phage tail protein [Hymenobacter sp. HSC-4F20]
MASIINATDVVVKANNIVVGCAQSADFTVSREMDEATCSSSGGWKQVSPGQKSWSGSFSAVFREFTSGETATNVSFDTIFDLLDDGTEVTIEYTKAAAGGKRYTGQAFISEVSYSQPDKGAVTWTANYEGNGAFTVAA